MTTRNLDKIFRPKRIAVLGASDTPKSIGSIALHNLIYEGTDRVVYPVTADRESVHGIQAYPTVTAVPHVPDLAVICTAADAVPGAVAECAAAGIPGVVILSTGFREAGAAGQALEGQLLQLARQHPQMRMLGPNSFGVLVPRLGLNASLATGLPKEGQVALVSQSQAFCVSTLDWALQENVGFSHFVSIGNGVDVHFSDLMDYFGGDPKTLALILYIVSIADVRQFMSAARAFARHKPIVAYRSGRFAESIEGAALHTGRMAGEDAVYEAAFRRAGIVRVSKTEDLFDCAGLLAGQHAPRGARLSIITNAGEPGSVAADALLDGHGTLATLSPATSTPLARLVLANYPYTNPAHLARNATAEEYAQATHLALQDRQVDAALVILVPRGTTDVVAVAHAVGHVAAQSFKPVLACWMGGRAVQAGIQALHEAGIRAYPTPEKAVRAFLYLVSYARNMESLYETPRDIPVSFTPRRGRLRSQVLRQGGEMLSERLSKTLLRTYEIPVTKPYVARSAGEALQLARRIGFPVVLKVLAPEVTYKAEVGGVALNLTTETGVQVHFDRIVQSVQRLHPAAHIQGVTVQKMIDAPHGFELILGSKRDPTFGAVLMVGAGGLATELIGDRALGLPPLNERLARQMLEALRSWPLLVGYRGKPGVNVDRLIEILVRLSYLVADHPEIRELDICPLLVTPEDAVALDARVRIDPGELQRPSRPFAHLAIRPYPEEFVQAATLRDGTPIFLRPVRPEDEPAWQALLAQCSDDTIRLRFRALLKRTAHEVATRYCYLDYDRDMAMAAEVEVAGQRSMVGVGNLFGEPDGESAEYAVLIADEWQRKGLGHLLTNCCVQVAESWGLKCVNAHTTRDNQRMVALFLKHGFQVECRDNDDVLVSKALPRPGSRD